jgi:hypothetical protein
MAFEDVTLIRQPESESEWPGSFEKYTNLVLERFLGSTITAGNQASRSNRRESYRNIFCYLKTEDR